LITEFKKYVTFSFLWSFADVKVTYINHETKIHNKLLFVSALKRRVYLIPFYTDFPDSCVGHFAFCWSISFTNVKAVASNL